MHDDAAYRNRSRHTREVCVRYIVPRSIEGLIHKSAIAVPWREVRLTEYKVCSYELSESLDEETVILQRGEVYVLNQSSRGILLLIGTMPRLGQIIEVNIPEFKGGQLVNLYEVRWVEPVRVDDNGSLYRAGCRLIDRSLRWRPSVGMNHTD
jgi:hypothetical protein